MNMIDPNELRLGNWVKDKYNNEVQITLDSFMMIGEQEMVYFPIPLTGRLFTKSGFDGDDNRFIHPDLPNVTFVEVDGGYRIVDSMGSGISVITHIHMLQNLYFALLGKEMLIDM